MPKTRKLPPKPRLPKPPPVVAPAVLADDTVLVAGLPRLRTEMNDAPRKEFVPQPPTTDEVLGLEMLAVQLAKQGFHPWLRHDGEEWVCELQCGVETKGWPAEKPRPLGRGVTLRAAVLAALAAKAEGEKGN